MSDACGGFDTHFQVSLLILGELLNELIRIVGLAIAGAGDLGYACEFVSALVGNGESDGGNRKCESLLNNTLGNLAGRLSAVGLTVGDQQQCGGGETLLLEAVDNPSEGGTCWGIAARRELTNVSINIGGVGMLIRLESRYPRSRSALSGRGSTWVGPHPQIRRLRSSLNEG